MPNYAKGITAPGQYQGATNNGRNDEDFIRLIHNTFDKINFAEPESGGKIIQAFQESTGFNTQTGVAANPAKALEHDFNQALEKGGITLPRAKEPLKIKVTPPKPMPQNSSTSSSTQLIHQYFNDHSEPLGSTLVNKIEATPKAEKTSYENALTSLIELVTKMNKELEALQKNLEKLATLKNEQQTSSMQMQKL